LTLLALGAGAVLADHRAAGPVAIQVLTGGATIKAGTVTHRVAEQQAIVLEPDVVHSVEADGDTLILLAIALTD
jgi:quercetin dioxygenase-like cupin family protein